MSEIVDQDEGARLRFKASDVRAMIEAGILDEGRSYEVLDGEILVMQAHNPPHMRVKRWLLDQLFQALAGTVWIDSEPSFYVEEDGDYTAPDLIVYPRDMQPQLVRGPDALLVIEVAATTLRKDLIRKAALYARHGVRDYWVVNAETLATRIFRDPQGGAYVSVVDVAPNEPLKPLSLPKVSLRMAELEG